MKTKMKIKKGDTVKIMSGKDRGKSGKVEKVLLKKNKALVTGLNLYKRHLKPQGDKKPGGIIEISKPLPVTNLALICPKCQQPTRIGYLIDQKGEKSRVCKKCQQVI
jgi:large subunit ribosomal protein L24